ncbi:membrane protein [Streptomyces viridochromogenes]|uniref:Membrane protein n=2 Tax=Streptomyces TaxID=1883 RepID=A0A0L8JCH1_STRVR|nr:membrane protein [Streptomyces viridochromogenes]
MRPWSRRQREDVQQMPERQSTNDDNPFAPPPEGRPDQPWQPRRPEGSDDDASGSPDASGPSDGRWSPRQPGPSTDGFGRGPERQGGGQGGPEGGPGQSGPGRQGLRWDPTDPAQRRARYAILAGMWAFFFAIFDIPELALLLGALGLYWAISSLRAKPKPAADLSPTSQPASQASGQVPGQVQGRTGGTAPGQGPLPGQASGQGASAAGAPLRSMRTAAISGLVAASVALMIVAVGFTMQVVYRDFYECRDDALTHAGQLACNDLLPKPLRAGFGVRE